jgi:hypothetical protein
MGETTATEDNPMKRPLILAATLLVTLAAGCGDGEEATSTATEPKPYEPLPNDTGWFRPTADLTWQWQITGELNASYDVDVYDIDAFENSGETIAELHDQGRRVVCYFSAGSYEPWQGDADRYDPQDIGNPLADWPDERWVDIRSPRIRAIMSARLDIAASKGCDAVEPDNVTAYRNDSGYDISADDQLAFNRWLADEAHARGMGIALKNDDDQVAELVDAFDFSVSEECHAFDECDAYAPFLQLNKPVFNAEYAESAAGAVALAATLCDKARAANTRTVILPWDLDDSFRVSCD